MTAQTTELPRPQLRSGNLMATELLKLRTVRTGWAFLLGFLLLQAAGLALVVRSAGRLGAPSLGTADHAIAFLGAGAGASLLLLVLGVLIVTTEHRHATITGILLVVPDRRRVLVAKGAAVIVIGLVAALVGVVLALLVGLVTGDLGGLAINGEVLAGLAGRVLTLPTYGLLGVGIGALVRHQTIAVVTPLLWFLVIETLVPAYGLRGLVPWLPGGAAAAMARDATIPGLLPAWAGALVLTGYVIAVGLLGAWRFRRADIA